MNFNSGTCIAALLLRKRAAVRAAVGIEDERGGRITDKAGEFRMDGLLAPDASQRNLSKGNSWHVLR